MKTKSLPAAILLAGLSLYSLSAPPLRAQQNKQIEQLGKEKLKLQRENDPVGRTKTQIKIADILLVLTGDALRDSDFERMRNYLNEYVAAIQDAHDTMMSSGRDAQKRAGGFKDLEIALRRHMRQLQDMGESLTLDLREPVEKARNQAAEIRDVILKALFGGQNV